MYVKRKHSAWYVFILLFLYFIFAFKKRLMCSILQFSDDNERLRCLFGERNYFDSLLFIFDGGRRYKVSTKVLGIHSVSDLLVPLGLGVFRSSPFWSYYLYPVYCNFHKGIDGLCGEVLRLTGEELQANSCHIFLSRSLDRLNILYRYGDEYRLESRRLNGQRYQLRKEERHMRVVSITWDRMNKLFTDLKPQKNNSKRLKK